MSSNFQEDMLDFYGFFLYLNQCTLLICCVIHLRHLALRKARSTKFLSGMCVGGRGGDVGLGRE